MNAGLPPSPVKRGKKALPPLPCGCDGSTGQGKKSAILMPDGTRVCRAHSKRWKLVWEPVE